MDEEAINQGSALRGRRRVILLCAPVTLLFTFADTLALGHFSPALFGLRLVWAGLIVAAAFSLGRVSQARERLIMLIVAVSSSLFFGAITWMTGGYKSPLFHWILAMPLVIAVVLQEFPYATLGAAIATMASGLAIVIAGGAGPVIAIEWAIQDFGMSALAVYASVTYRRLRFREQALRETAAVAAERARASEQAVKARDVFLSIAAHELRTPLTSLVLNADRLLRASGDDEDEAGRGLATALHRQVRGLSALVESLLDISRLSIDRPSLQLAPVQLGALVSQVVERYQPTAQRNGCSITVDLQATAIVKVDKTRFEQVLLNLLSNASKFGREKPIEVTVAAQEGRARVTVRDYGVGVAPSEHEQIFDRFNRGSAPLGNGGLGLGLWISRRLIEEMGGQLRVESRPGEGAAFTFELPAVVAETSHPELAGASALHP